MPKGFKELIRSIVNRTGYDIRRIPKTNKLVSTTINSDQRANKNRKIIELIGPPGVGKTSIYDDITRQEKNNKDWIRLDSIPLLNGINLNSKFVYEYLLDLKIKSISEKVIPSEQKYRKIEFYYKTLLKDSYISRLNTDSHIFIDEGVFHRFPTELILFYKNHPDAFADFAKNRLIINCYGSPEIVKDRIRERQHTKGQIWHMHKNMNDEELMSCNKKIQSTKSKMVNILLENQVRCIEINMDDERHQNVKIIEEFIKNC